MRRKGLANRMECNHEEVMACQKQHTAADIEVHGSFVHVKGSSNSSVVKVEVHRLCATPVVHIARFAPHTTSTHCLCGTPMTHARLIAPSRTYYTYYLGT